MKKIAFAITASFLFLALGPGQASWAESYPPGYYDAADQANLLTPEELDDLLAPIALYPDPLIAQILPAATFVDQIDEAARYVRQYGRAARIDVQPWDVSVKAVAHYPDVLFMMDQKYDWTVSLGQAFIDQEQDVMDAIQRLRADALEQGNLFSTAQQQVIDDPDGIRIVPAAPEYVYVPVYDPQVVYVERYDPSYPLITFGVGLAIGAWLNRDFDWGQHRVYYHGWRGGGWISRSRPQIRERGNTNIYINKNLTVINVNKKVLQHDNSRFRQELRSDALRQREEHRMPVAPRANQPRPGRIEPQRPQGGNQPRPTERGRQREPEAGRQRGLDSRTQPAPATTRPAPVTAQPAPVTTRTAPAHQPVPATVQPFAAGGGQVAPARGGRDRAGTRQPAPATGQTAAPAIQPPAAAISPQTAPTAGRQPAAAGKRTETRPTTATDVFRGRDVQRAQPASHSGYGGYGSGSDATIYRQRGQASQEQMRQTTRPAAAPPSAAPAPRPVVAPAPRPAAAPVAAPRPAAAPAPRPAMAPRPPAAAAPSAPRPAAPHPAAQEKK